MQLKDRSHMAHGERRISRLMTSKSTARLVVSYPLEERPADVNPGVVSMASPGSIVSYSCDQTPHKCAEIGKQAPRILVPSRVIRIQREL